MVGGYRGHRPGAYVVDAWLSPCPDDRCLDEEHEVFRHARLSSRCPRKDGSIGPIGCPPEALDRFTVSFGAEEPGKPGSVDQPRPREFQEE